MVLHRASLRAFRFVSACRRRFTSEVTTRQMIRQARLRFFGGETNFGATEVHAVDLAVDLAPRESDRARWATDGTLL